MPFHTSPSYSLCIRLRIPRKPGMLGRLTTKIGDEKGVMGAINIVNLERGRIIRDLVVYAHDEDHENRIIDALKTIPDVEILGVFDRTFEYHKGGKIRVEARKELENPDDLAIAYTPGVGRISLAVADNLDSYYQLTMKGNSVAVVTDGTAVLGLGNIGPHGALPVMEGKALLFQKFAGIDAFPICLNVTGVDEIISVVKAISPAFGGINLEDISAPRCFEIEERLKQELSIPVFHDDQHGTAIAVLAALRNALKIIGKEMRNIRIVVSGIGAAGVACIKILMSAGAQDIIPCDRIGAIHPGRTTGMNSVKETLANEVNSQGIKGTLKEVLKGADVFIGVSGGNILKPEDLAVMNKDAIVFALANPVPEVDPDGAQEYVRILATGRSDFPNQINNVLVFPGMFRGALDSRAKTINTEMKMAAADAIAGLIGDDELEEESIIPTAFHQEVSKRVAKMVVEAALKSGAV